MTLQSTPKDVLLLILDGLDPLDQVCLALTSKELYSLTITAHGHQCLNDLIAYKPPGIDADLRSSNTNTPSHFILRHLLARLVSWVPDDHKWCSRSRDKFIVGGDEGTACDRCMRVERLRKEEKLMELREREEKGLKLEWYDRLGLEGNRCVVVQEKREF